MKYFLLFILLACTKPEMEKPYVVYIAFDGWYLSKWTYPLEPVQLTDVQKDSIEYYVKKDFAQFPVRITRSFAIYLKTDEDKRHVAVVTQNVKLFFVNPGDGGLTDQVGSFTVNPNLVFWDRVRAFVEPEQHVLRTARLITHELGHSLGLWHYRDTIPDHALMGHNWYSLQSTWAKGVNEHNRVQDDIKIINKKLQ
jgi:hypothetical protein